MIKIEIIGQGYIDVSPSLELPMELTSSLFKESIAEQGYSYPISFPLTPNNAKLFGFIHLPDSSSRFDKSYPINLYFNNILLLQGTLLINKVNPKKIFGFILEYDFDSNLLNTKLRSIYMGGDRQIIGTWSSITDHANDSLTQNSDTWDYVFFPVVNKKIHNLESANQDLPLAYPYTYTHIVNLWDFHNQSFWRPYSYANQVMMGPGEGDSYVNYSVPPSQSTFVPFPYVLSVLRYIANFLGGYSLDGDFSLDPIIKKLVVYNTVTLDKITAPPIQLPQNHGEETINLVNHLPDITIKEFLDGLAIFNVDIKIHNKKISINRKAKGDDEFDLTLYCQDRIEISSDGETANHGVLLQMSFDESDLFDSMDKDYTLSISKIKSDSTSSAGYNAEDIYFNPDTYSDYIVDGLKQPNYSRFTGAKKLHIGGDVISEKSVNAGTLRTIKNYPIKYATIDYTGGSVVPTDFDSGIIPVAEQPGKSKVYLPGENNEFSLRFLFYAGMFSDPNGFGEYPIGTSDIYDDAGNEILPYSLKWLGGEQSLYYQWHQDWEQLISQKKSIQIPLKIPISEYMKLDFSKKYRIKNRLYLMRKVSLTFKSGIISGLADMVQI